LSPIKSRQSLVIAAALPPGVHDHTPSAFQQAAKSSPFPSASHQLAPASPYGISRVVPACSWCRGTSVKEPRFLADKAVSPLSAGPIPPMVYAGQSGFAAPKACTIGTTASPCPFAVTDIRKQGSQVEVVAEIADAYIQGMGFARMHRHDSLSR